MMSHEINNSVGAVNSILDSQLSYGEQLTPEDRRDFEHVTRVAIERNNGLNKFMSNFATVVRIPSPVREQCDLHELLRSVEVLMGSSCSANNITWKLALCDSALIVHTDVQQMEQVLVNIVKNAIEAMEAGGTLTVETTIDKTATLRIIDTGEAYRTRCDSIYSPRFTVPRRTVRSWFDVDSRNTRQPRLQIQPADDPPRPHRVFNRLWQQAPVDPQLLDQSKLLYVGRALILNTSPRVLAHGSISKSQCNIALPSSVQ